LKTFSRTTSFRPSFAALSELVDSQLIEIVPSKLDSVGNTVIDVDISVSAKAAREDFRSNDVLWRVNFGHINRCLQHVACAELVREEVNESASRLLLAMLEISRLHGHITNDGTPVRLSEADILERLISDSSQKNSSDVEVSLHECLTTLQNDPWKLLSAHLMDSAGNTQKRYSVDFSRILDMIRVKEQLEAVVRERFGGPACRIFRLLLLKHNLEQKQIAEMVGRSLNLIRSTASPSAQTVFATGHDFDKGHPRITVQTSESTLCSNTRGGADCGSCSIADILLVACKFIPCQ